MKIPTATRDVIINQFKDIMMVLILPYIT
jgi:hypothetical protein